MAKKEYAFYPGCSSQLKASASNYLVSTNSMCTALDIKLTEIPDWNCCGASIGYAEGGELPRLALSARNFALAETHMPGKEMVATCAACWLAQREVKERLDHSEVLLKEPAEMALYVAMRDVTPRAQAQFEAGDYAASLQSLAVLRAPVDAFVDSVMVNAEELDVRLNRQGLLTCLHDSMNRLADLSRLAA